MDIIINGKKRMVADIRNIIKICEEEIPRFCYTKTLSVVGNCRMCLVEIRGLAKLIASCATPLLEGMEIFTRTEKVKKGREGVMEHLLKDHPLDCVICDLGGECGLQEQSRREGSDKGRMFEIRREVEDKYIGPLIEGIMLRCIQCSRCVRYNVDIGGEGKGGLGLIGRGGGTEINSDENNIWNIAGNIIDLCPVCACMERELKEITRYLEEKMEDVIPTLDTIFYMNPKHYPLIESFSKKQYKVWKVRAKAVIRLKELRERVIENLEYYKEDNDIYYLKACGYFKEMFYIEYYNYKRKEKELLIRMEVNKLMILDAWENMLEK